MYADFDYYENSFAGTLIPARDFISFENKASRYLNYVTQHRIKTADDRVKNAACAAAEALYEMHQQYANVPKGIKSENTDGYSVTFAEFDLEKFKRLEKEAMHKTIVQELSGTGLLFRGVR
jgi:hypothetical protein